jgi:ATP-dependent helicase/nuclease subunit B
LKVERLSPDILQALESGATLVVPSSQRQVALRSAWGRVQRDRGAKVWDTPRVDSLGQHIERRLREQWAARGEPDRLLPPAAEWAELREWRREQGGVAEARALLNSVRTLYDWRIGSRSLGRTLGDSPEANILQEAVEKLARLRDDGRRPTREWLDDIAADGRPLVAAGFSALPPRQQSLLDRLGARGLALGAGAAQPFSLARADDDTHELELIAAWCRRELEQDPARRLLIVDSRLRERRRGYETTLSQCLNPSHWVRAEAREFSTVFAIEGGQPLAEFPLVAHAVLTLRLVTGQLRFDELITWLRLPFLDRDDAYASAAVESIVRDGRRLEYRASELAAAIERVNDAPAGAMHLSMGLRRALEEIAGERRSAAEWARALQAALRVLGWPGARTLRSDEQQTVQRWHALLDEFSALGAWLPRLDAAAAVATLSDLAAERQFDPASVDAPITLTDAHDDPLVHYDSIWVAGLDASQWPAPARPDVFIPTMLQIAAGVPWATAKGQSQVARGSFAAWRARTSNLICSWAALDGDAHRTPSPLLARIGGATDYTPATIFLPLAAQWAGAETEAVLDDAGIPWNRALQVAGGVRTLELQAECGFHAYGELRLDARVLEDPEPGIDPRDRGNLLHRALHLVWQRFQTHFRLFTTELPERTSLIAEDVAAAIRYVFRGDVPNDLAAAVERERFRLEQLIGTLLARELTRPQFDVADMEVKRDCQIAGGRFQLRIDRVDKLQGGGYAILDYKSGTPRSPRWEGEKIRNPQLLAYLHAESRRPIEGLANVFLTHNTAKFSGKCVHSNLLPDIRGVGKSGEDEIVTRARWEQLRTEWLATVERLASEYLAGTARVQPAPDVCRLCPLTILCRRLETTPDAAREETGGADE